MFLNRPVIVALITLFLGGIRALCADAVAVTPATNVVLGERSTVYVTGTVSTGGDITMVISYNPLVMRLLSVRGKSSYALLCDVPEVLSDVSVAYNERQITIRCAFGVSVTTDTLAELLIEGAAGADTVGQISVTSLSINGVPQQGLVSEPGFVFRTGGNLGAAQPWQGISGNYPNPFRSTTKLRFSVVSAGTVRVSMLTTQGRLVEEYPPFVAVAGENSFDVEIIAWNVSGGAYILRLVTDSGTYYHPVTVMK